MQTHFATHANEFRALLTALTARNNVFALVTHFTLTDELLAKLTAHAHKLRTLFTADTVVFFALGTALAIVHQTAFFAVFMLNFAVGNAAVRATHAVQFLAVFTANADEFLAFLTADTD